MQLFRELLFCVCHTGLGKRGGQMHRRGGAWYSSAVFALFTVQGLLYGVSMAPVCIAAA
jgi:hypothetical protein